MTAALALPGIAVGATVLDDVLVDYKHLSYIEDELMEVQADYFNLGIPINDKNDLLMSVEYEAMAGASPIFLLPGAGGTVTQVTTGVTVPPAPGKRNMGEAPAR